ncbi:MAG: bifunctional DNA primase/polymerase [Alphaproteobacteria bacterium]|nr:bifunctional DNA primase/polymerase [Alphaproteobacteria bacterium]
MNRATLLASAIKLAALGLRPVPMIAADKRPALKGWRERESCNAEAVAALFADAPRASGLAIATGAGVVVIDLDRNHASGADGVKSFAALIAEHGRGEVLALGPRVRTPRRGVHLHFACDPARIIRNRVALAPGVDVKGQGGLAMAPPSPGYCWAPSPFERAPPQAPSWLMALIDPPKPLRPSPAPARTYSGTVHPYARAVLERELNAVAGAQAGGRNAALFKAAASLGALAAAGALPIEPLASGLLEAAHACGLIGDDGIAAAESTIASGLKRGLENPRAVPQRQQRRRA